MPRSKNRNKLSRSIPSVVTQGAPQPVVHQRQQIIEQKFHQGPLPAAEELAAYDRILQGAANRIICMAEQQAEHRQHLEKDSLTSDTNARERQLSIESNRIQGTLRNERIGQILGFLVAALCVAAAAWGLMHNAGIGQIGLFLGLPIMGVVKAFLPRRPKADKK